VDAGFVDLDILLTRIRHPQSKVYFLDAVKAYKAGALRGALTSAWVALAYDLIAKYRELSAIGDAAATAFLLSWDNATAAGDIAKLLQLEGAFLRTQPPTPRLSIASPERIWTACAKTDIFAPTRHSRPRPISSNTLPS
jgi:hypothetical protein